MEDILFAIVVVAIVIGVATYGCMDRYCNYKEHIHDFSRDFYDPNDQGDD